MALWASFTWQSRPRQKLDLMNDGSHAASDHHFGGGDDEMNLRHLEVFRLVVSTGNTLGAARALNLSRSAVAEPIAAVERSVGSDLFFRTGDELVPTKQAIDVFLEISPALSKIESCWLRPEKPIPPCQISAAFGRFCRTCRAPVMCRIGPNTTDQLRLPLAGP